MTTPATNPMEDDPFAKLKTLVGALRFLAFVAGAISVIGLILSLVTFGEGSQMLVASIACAASAASLGVLSSLISLGLAVEENTRKTMQATMKMADRQPTPSRQKD